MKVSLFYLAKAHDSYSSGLVKTLRSLTECDQPAQRKSSSGITITGLDVSVLHAQVGYSEKGVGSYHARVWVKGTDSGRQAAVRKRKSSFHSVANFVVSYTSLLSLQYQIQYTLPIQSSPRLSFE